MEGTLDNQDVFVMKGKLHIVPSVDETLRKRGYSADAKATGDALNQRVKTADIIDNLISSSTDRPLSANQGRLLKKQLDSFHMSQAGLVGYNNGKSGLESSDMQGAIDEVVVRLKAEEEATKNLPETYMEKGKPVGGTVLVQNVDNGYGSVMKNHSASADYGTLLADTSKNGKTAKITVSAALNLLTFTDVDGQIRDIHHEGTKPFGSYFGNGNDAERLIDTGGLGRMMMVYCDSAISFVTPKGALSVSLADGTMKWIDGTKAYCINGILHINTTNAAFNTDDVEYYYQVI